MNSAPSFFVPGCEAAQADERYAAWAVAHQRVILPPAERIYSISFDHDGENWTATVGQRLSGIKRGLKNGKPTQKSLADLAVVQAILPGNPYIVYTNKGLVVGVRSSWENPFFARASSVTKFGAST